MSRDTARRDGRRDLPGVCRSVGRYARARVHDGRRPSCHVPIVQSPTAADSGPDLTRFLRMAEPGNPETLNPEFTFAAPTDNRLLPLPIPQLLEASELVKQIEETFGVDASAPAGGMVMAAGPGGGGAEEAAEKTEFDLVITDVDASKRIAIIKVVRGLTSLGLKEAKDAVTNLPFTILEGKTKGECEEAMKTLEEGGAKAEMK